MRQSRLSLAHSLSAFGSWWVAELTGMLPVRLRRLFRRRGDQLVLELSSDDLILRRWGGDNLVEIGRLSLTGTGDGEQRSILRELLAEAGAKARHVTLLLPRGRSLRKLLSLPAPAEENLHQVLSFEMDRQTPFRAEEVYFDHKVRARRKDTGRIDLELVVLPRAIVDAAVEKVRRLGLTPDIVGVAGHDHQDPSAFNLLPEAHAAVGRKRSRQIAFVLGLVALALLAAAIQVPLERQRTLANALAAQTVKAREEAEIARQLREQIDQALEQGRQIVLKKMQRPSIVHVLDEITRLLNDETWLIRMRLQEDEVQIFGYSNAASMLIGAIEESPLFADAQFRAPVTRDPRVDAERFHMAFRITEPRPQVAGAESDEAREPPR